MEVFLRKEKYQRSFKVGMKHWTQRVSACATGNTDNIDKVQLKRGLAAKGSNNFKIQEKSSKGLETGC